QDVWVGDTANHRLSRPIGPLDTNGPCRGIRCGAPEPQPGERHDIALDAWVRGEGHYEAELPDSDRYRERGRARRRASRVNDQVARARSARRAASAGEMRHRRNVPEVGRGPDASPPP